MGIRTLSILSTIILLINCVLFIRSFDKQVKALKFFVPYLVAILIIQVVSTILGRLKIPNIYFSHYYFIIQFILLSLFYSQVFISRTIKKIVLLAMIPVLLGIGIQYFFDPGLYFRFNLIEIIVLTTPLIVYSFLFLVQTLSNPKKEFIYINSGVLLYLLCSTLIFSSGNIMQTLPENINEMVWTANAFLYLVYQVLIFIEWYKHFRKKEILG
jgi:hypothetical protein